MIISIILWAYCSSCIKVRICNLIYSLECIEIKYELAKIEIKLSLELNIALLETADYDAAAIVVSYKPAKIAMRTD